MALNIVEFMQEPDADCAWDQPCKFGHRVETHAVYCHNDDWQQSPRKCRRNRDDFRHEDCPGFTINPEFKGELVSSRVGELCAYCWGVRTIVDSGGRKTCPECDGYGIEPTEEPITATQAEMLEHACLDWESIAVIAILDEQDHQALFDLIERGLYCMRSMHSVGRHTVVICEPTGRGRAALQFYWDRKEQKAPRDGGA